MQGRQYTTRLRSPDGEWIGPEELQEILADEGYSAGNREQFLKSVLTEMSRQEARSGVETERRDRLRREVRRILADEQGKSGQAPISDDTL